MGLSYLHGGLRPTPQLSQHPWALPHPLHTHRCSVFVSALRPSPCHLSVLLLKAFNDLLLCFPLVRSGRKGRRRVFSLSEADSHGGHWV